MEVLKLGPSQGWLPSLRSTAMTVCARRSTQECESESDTSLVWASKGVST